MRHENRKPSVLLGLAVRDLRRREKISQMKLAERAQLSLTYVSEIERGRRVPSMDVVIQIGRAFGITGWELMRRAGV